MATKVKRTKDEPIEIEAGSGNVFEDLGLPDAGERLAKAETCASNSEDRER